MGGGVLDLLEWGWKRPRAKEPAWTQIMEPGEAEGQCTPRKGTAWTLCGCVDVTPLPPTGGRS